MNIKIVTDSTADIRPDQAQEMNVEIIPAYIHFGDKVYKARVDMNDDDFYARLTSGSVQPYTEPPTPQDFANVYRDLSRKVDSILSIHISSRLSATYNAALRGKEIAETNIPIVIVDSQLVSVGLGLLVAAAAKDIRDGKDLGQVTEAILKYVPAIRMFGMFDTLKYLALGGRIGKAKALLGSVIRARPILTMRDGELESAGRANSRLSGMEKLFSLVQTVANIQDLAICYSTDINEAQTLAERIGATFSKDRIRIARLGAVLGVHGGPGCLFVAMRVGE